MPAALADRQRVAASFGYDFQKRIEKVPRSLGVFPNDPIIQHFVVMAADLLDLTDKTHRPVRKQPLVREMDVEDRAIPVARVGHDLLVEVNEFPLGTLEYLQEESITET